MSSRLNGKDRTLLRAFRHQLNVMPQTDDTTQKARHRLALREGENPMVFFCPSSSAPGEAADSPKRPQASNSDSGDVAVLDPGRRQKAPGAEIDRYPVGKFLAAAIATGALIVGGPLALNYLKANPEQIQNEDHTFSDSNLEPSNAPQPQTTQPGPEWYSPPQETSVIPVPASLLNE